MENKPKRLKIYPIWIFFGIIFVIGWINNRDKPVVNWFYICLILSLLIHHFNTKRLGRFYYIKDEKKRAEKLKKSTLTWFGKNYKIGWKILLLIYISIFVLLIVLGFISYFTNF